MSLLTRTAVNAWLSGSGFQERRCHPRDKDGGASKSTSVKPCIRNSTGCSKALLLCIRYLNRETTTSLLNEQERYRFHRALYRLWIVDRLDFMIDFYVLNPSPSVVSGLFKSFNPRELIELREAVCFIKAIHSAWHPGELPSTISYSRSSVLTWLY